MFIEFIDQLRCTNDHEESWLVAAFKRREDRFIIDATLGCHICLREYVIADGIAYFGGRNEPASAEGSVYPADEMPMRAAAFLAAAEGSTLVLAGSWGTYAHEVAALLPLRIFALDPVGDVDDSERVAVIRSSEGVPLAARSVHGVAFDLATATEVNLRTAIRVLRSGGRLVAPVKVSVPAEVSVLARDEAYWVGVVSGPIVPLRRA